MSPIGARIPRDQPAPGREAAALPPELTPGHIDELSRALKIMAETQDPAAVRSSAQDRTVSLIQSFVAEEGGRSLLEAPGNAREARFDEHDIHWREFWKYAGKLRRYPWVENLVSPTELPDPARLALFGDWGTALYGAKPISAAIASAKPAYDASLSPGRYLLFRYGQGNRGAAFEGLAEGSERHQPFAQRQPRNVLGGRGVFSAGRRPIRPIGKLLRASKQALAARRARHFLQRARSPWRPGGVAPETGGSSGGPQTGPVLASSAVHSVPLK